MAQWKMLTIATLRLWVQVMLPIKQKNKKKKQNKTIFQEIATTTKK